MIELGLRARFIVSGVALVATTVASGVWSALAFSRMSQVMGETLIDTEQTTAATAAMANALEREDDGLLLWLSGSPNAERDLAAARASVVEAEARLDALLTTPSEHAAARALGRDVDAYHAAGDALVAAPPRLDLYHRDVNPLLRRAVADAGRIRDQHFRATEEAAVWARDEARRATFLVTGISAAALLLSAIVSFRIARRIVWPLRELSASVGAVRRGDLERRPIRASDHELGRLAEDVTALVRLDEMRLELIAVASHELRTPLTTMRMTLSMLQEDAGGLPPRQQDLVSTALVGVDQLAETIDEFLDLTRIEAGQLRLSWDRVDVAALVGQAVRAVGARCQEAGIALRVVVADDAPTGIDGDPVRLRAVLANVLTNAVKYTPAGGAVTVEVAALADPAWVQIAVTDTGRGVPAEYRARIFDKFFRVEHHVAGGDQGVRGSGIGLYVSRQIVEAHGGRIGCEPGKDGQGTRIVVALPRQTSPPRPPSPQTGRDNVEQDLSAHRGRPLWREGGGERE